MSAEKLPLLAVGLVFTVIICGSYPPIAVSYLNVSSWSPTRGR